MPALQKFTHITLKIGENVLMVIYKVWQKGIFVLFSHTPSRPPPHTHTRPSPPTHTHWHTQYTHLYINTKTTAGFRTDLCQLFICILNICRQLYILILLRKGMKTPTFIGHSLGRRFRKCRKMFFLCMQNKRLHTVKNTRFGKKLN